MLLASGQANFGVNMDSFLKGTERVRNEMQKIKGLKARIEAEVALKTGSVQALRADVKKKLENSSKGLALEVDARIKTGALSKLKSDVTTAVGQIKNGKIEIGVKVTAGAATSINEITKAVQKFDALSKANRKISIDVAVGAGIGAKVKAVNDLLAKLTATKYSIKVDLTIDPAMMATLKQMDTLLKQATQNADRLRTSLNRAGAGGSGGLNTRNVQDYDNALSHLVNTIRRFLVGYLGVKLLIDGFRALKEATIDYNVAIVTAENSLTRMLDFNHQKALAIIKDLQAFAERTPYKFAELLPIVTQLRLAKIDADRLVPSLEALGNVAATTGNGAEGIMRMANSFRDAAARGRITGEEVRELSRQAIPVYEYIAKSWNISVQKAQEYVRKGLIPAKEATDAIIKNASADPRFAKALEQASKTLPGALSNIGDVLQRVLGGAFKKTYDDLTAFANKVADFVSTKGFQEWANDAAQKIIYVMTMIGQVIKFIIGLLFQFRGVVMVVIAAVAARFAWLALVGLASMAVSLVNLTGRVMVFGATAIQALQALNPWVRIAILGLVLYATNWFHIRDIVNGVITGIMEALRNVSAGVASLVEWLAKIPGASALLGDQTGLAQGVADEWDSRIRATDEGLQKFSETLDKSKGEINAFFGSFSNALNINSLIASWGQKASAAAKAAVASIPNYEGKFTTGKDDKGSKKAAREALAREKDALKDNAKAWQLYAKAVQDAARQQIEAYRDMRKELSSFFEDAQKKLVELGAVSDPLGPMIRNLEKLLSIGDKMKGVAGYSQAITDEANRVARASGTKVEKLSKLDGRTPQSIAASMDREAVNKTSSAMLLSIAKSFNQGEPYYSCAFVASRLANAVGANIKTTASAGGLRANAIKAGWTRVAGDDIQKGDLIFNRRKGGSGWHVKTGAGDGDVVNSNHREETLYRNYRAKRNEEVWRAPNRVSTRDAQLRRSFGVKPTMENIAGGGVEGLGSDFGNTLTGINAIPKAWGKAVTESKDAQVRFLLQTQLTNVKFQQQIDAIATATRSVPETMEAARARVIRWFRDFANSADFLINRMSAIKAAEANMRDYRKTVALAGQEGDPFAQLDYERRGERANMQKLAGSKNKKLASMGNRGLQTLNWEQQGLRAAVQATMNAATEKAIALAKAQADAQSQVDSQIDGSVGAMNDYSRSVEEINIRLKAQNDLWDLLHSKNAGTRKDAQANLESRVASEIETLRSSRVRQLTIDLANNTAAVQERVTFLQAEGAALRDNAFSNEMVTERTEAANKFQQVYNQTLNAYKDVLGATAARQIAAYQAGKAFNEVLDVQKLEKANAALRERNSALATLATAIDFGGRAQSILNNTFSFDPAQERALREAQLRAEYNTKIKSGQSTIGAASEAIGTAMQQFDADQALSVGREVNKILSDNAQATKTWSDLTVTANIVFQTTYGSLKGLAQEVKDSLIESVKSTEALRYSTDQLQSATSAAWSIRQELEEKSIGNNQKLTEVQKQLIKWRYADLEAASRGINLTNEQAEAIKKARNEVQALLEQVDAQAKIDKVREATEQVLQDIHSVFVDAFQSIYEDGFGGFVDNMLNGLTDMLNKMASEILASYALQMLIKMIPGVGEFYGKMGAGGGNILQSALQAGAGALGGGSDIGTAYTYQDAARGVINSPTSESYANSTMNSKSVTYNMNYNIGSVKANDPATFAKEVRRTSDGQKARELAEVVEYGNGKR